MTNSNQTLIAALLDRSGSMQDCKQATEDGWRELIDAQRGNAGHCRVMLAQFDVEYELLYPPTDIAEVPDFVVEPRAATALLDAAGKFITDVGQRLSAMPEQQRPGQVICLIMTDGMENSSRDWTWDEVNRLITQQREVYGWEFIFLGADIDAVAVGARMGMDRRYAMTYDKENYLSNRSAYTSTHEMITEARRGGCFSEAGFTAGERKAALGEEAGSGE